MAYLEMHDSTQLALKCSYEEREIAKSIGNYKWDPSTKLWIFPLNREVVEKARQVFEEIAIEPEVLTHLRLMDSFQTKIQKIKKFKDCQVDESFLKLPLWPHQRVGARFCQEFEKCCCFDEMGLGKSFIAIYMAVWRKAQGKIKKCIVLAPKSCKESVWARQIEKFTREKSLIVGGSPSKRDKIYKQYLKRDILFLIFSYETFRVDFDKLKEIGILNHGNKGTEMIILDEIQKVKNVRAQISKAVKNAQVRFSLGLTGTPVYNRPEDIFGPMHIISPGLLGGNFWKFSDHYLKKGGYKKHQVVGYQNLKELKVKVESVSIRRLKEEILNLPEKTYEDLICEMIDPKQKEAYESMREELYALVQGMSGEEIKVQAMELMTRNIRLSQIADGFIMGRELKKPKWFDSTKIKEIDTLVSDYGDSGIVIFCRWVALVKFLHERYEKKYNAVYFYGQTKDADRLKAIDKFQGGEAKVFVLQIQSGSLGIDLSRAKIGIFVDKAFLSPGVLRQAEDRIHRAGLKEACTMVSLIAKGTIDERWQELMQIKLKLSEKIIPVMPRLDKKDWLYLSAKGS